MNLLRNVGVLTLLLLLPLQARAITPDQLWPCFDNCSFLEMEQVAIDNRYATISTISVFNDDTYDVTTFRVIDASEPGQPMFETNVVATPPEVAQAAQYMKDLRAGFIAASLYSPFVNQDIVSVTPYEGFAHHWPPPVNQKTSWWATIPLPTKAKDPHMPDSWEDVKNDDGAQTYVAQYVHNVIHGNLDPEDLPEDAQEAQELMLLRSRLKHVTVQFEDGSKVEMILVRNVSTMPWDFVEQTAVDRYNQPFESSSVWPSVIVEPNGPWVTRVLTLKCYDYEIERLIGGVYQSTTEHTCYISP